MKISLLIFVSLLLISGCNSTNKPVDTRNSTLTQGNIQLNLVVGKTTKFDVIENFGSPNITTRDGQGREVWSYQRAGQVSQSSSSSSGWTIILAGGSNRAAGFESSSRMMTLIIKFDSNDIVADFRSRTSNF